jgi:hypothetical protein
MAGRTRRRGKPSVTRIVAWLVVVLLGGWIVATKVGAARALAAPPVASGAALAAPPLEPSAVVPAGSALPAQEAAPAKPVELEAKLGADSEDAVTNQTLTDAVIQTEKDFPEDASDEQKEAMGLGNVPIHREGKYRSPFANPAFGGPARVKVGLVISEVRDYQITTGGFEADFFLSFTADKPIPKLRPVFTNGHDVDCTDLVNVPTFKFARCNGTFSSGVDLRAYPFDTQFLPISIEDAVYGVDTILFEPDPQRTSLDAGFRLTGYGVASVGATAYKHQYPPRFDRDDLYVSRYKFSLGLDRFAQSAAFSVFVPAFIIVIISLIGLWVPPSELEVRSSAGAPMLAAAVFFHYSLIQSLPATGYLTHADKLMLGVYICLALNMATTWAFLLVDESKVDGMFRFFRATVPPLTMLIMVASVIL